MISAPWRGEVAVHGALLVRHVAAGEDFLSGGDLGREDGGARGEGKDGDE
jgi:hypothetical protein